MIVGSVVNPDMSDDGDQDGNGDGGYPRKPIDKDEDPD